MNPKEQLLWLEGIHKGFLEKVGPDLGPEDRKGGENRYAV